jgi:hypothetical protein
LQFLTFQKPPKYGFEPGFPLLRQHMQVKQDRCPSLLGSRIAGVQLLSFLDHDFHRELAEHALPALARTPSVGYNSREEFL